MTDEKPEEFGKRAPPVVLHKRQSPTADERPPVGQKRSLAVALAVMGALPIGAYETFDWIDRKLHCEPDPANPEEQICKDGGGSTYRRSRGWHWSSGSSSGNGWHWSSGGSTHGVSFGGFGHSGGFSGGG